MKIKEKYHEKLIKVSKTNNSRQLVKNTFSLYVRMLFSMFIGFFTSRILMNQLGIVDFGIYNVIGGVLVILSFLNTTLTLSTQRFLIFSIENNNNNEANKVFNTSLTIHGAFAFIIFIVAETIGLWFLNTQMNIPNDRLFTANIVYQVTVISSMINICQVPFVSAIIAHEKISQYATIGIIDVILRFSVALGLVYVTSDKLKVYSFLILVVAIINFLIYSTYSKRHFRETTFKINKEKRLYQKMLSFSGWNVFSAISIAANGQIVNVLLNIFFGPVVNAARGISMQASGAVSGFVGNFQITVNPQIIKLYATKEFEKFHILIKQSAKFSFFLLLIFALPVTIKIDGILKIWLVQVPEYAPIFCQIILITSLINTFSLPLATAANATGNIKKFQLSTGCVELMNIPASYILLLSGFPAYSVFLVSASITIITLIIRLIILRSLINLNIRDFVLKVILRSFATAIITGIIAFWINQLLQSNTLLITIIFVLLCIITSVLVVFGLGLNRNERQFIRSMIYSKLRK